MKRRILGFVIAVVAVGAPWAAAFAATPVVKPVNPAATTAPAAVSATTPTPGQGLEISPPVLEIPADPGQTVTATIRVRNVSAGTLIATGKADDFGASGEDGKPKLLLDEKGATRFSLKYWVSSVPTLTLAPQELKTAVVNINVPKNAEPGGHFGVIRFTGTPPNLQGTGVSLSASVGTLVLLRVSGAITDKLSLASFTTNQKNKPSKFFEHGPVDFIVRLQNDGSVHEKPTGTIVIKNMLGKTTSTIKVNPLGGNVLPDSIRRFDESLSKKQLFGRYTAVFSGKYLDDNHTVTGKVTFWVIPWKLLLLGLAGLIALGYLLKLSLKRYNAFIISQARKR